MMKGEEEASLATASELSKRREMKENQRNHFTRQRVIETFHSAAARETLLVHHVEAENRISKMLIASNIAQNFRVQGA